MSRLKFNIETIDNELRTGHVTVNELSSTVNKIKKHENYKGQRIIHPLMPLLIQHIFIITYRLEDISSITLKIN